MLLCESNPEGVDNLLEILNDEHGKHWILKCRKMLRLLAAGTTLYKIPNFQACHKIGMGHWNRDELYPSVMKNLLLRAKDAQSTLKCLSWCIGYFNSLLFFIFSLIVASLK